MEVLNVLQAKLHLAQRVLDDLIRNYSILDDTERLEKSNTILDQVNSYLQIEGNLFCPLIQKTGRHQDISDRLGESHQQIGYITEHMVEMHVDEPGGEYYNRLVQLQQALARADKLDRELLIPWANHYLSEEDQYEIATHLKNQMVHESLPSSGMTIY